MGDSLEMRLNNMIEPGTPFDEKCGEYPDGWILAIILDKNGKGIGVFDTTGAEHQPVEGKTIDLVQKLYWIEINDQEFIDFINGNPDGDIKIMIFDVYANEVASFDTRKKDE